jgi:isoleucyl-tRNA synthetase
LLQICCSENFNQHGMCYFVVSNTPHITDLSVAAPCCNPQVLATLKGSALAGCTYTHPLYDRTSPCVVGGDYITTESGTGLVHTAPGHGQEDYQVR